MKHSGKHFPADFKELVWLLVPLIGIVELVAQIGIDLRIPSMEDWDAAADAIRAQHDKDDLVVITPWWATHGFEICVRRDIPREWIVGTHEISHPEEAWFRDDGTHG